MIWYLNTAIYSDMIESTGALPVDTGVAEHSIMVNPYRKYMLNGILSKSHPS